MALDSDPDYNPLQSEDNSNDEDDDDDISTPSSTKRYRSESDQENDSYFLLGSVSKKTKLVQSGDKDVSFKTSKHNSILKYKDIAFVYHCSFCYYQTVFRSYLKKHSKSCKKSSSKKHFECPKCEVIYCLEDLLGKDSLPVDQNSVDRHVFLCTACSFDTDDKSETVVLEKVHPSTKNSRCPLCKVRINGFNTLKKHLISKHETSIMYRCEYCQYSTSESESLLQHKKTHADLQDMGLIQCSHCHLEFFTMSEFKQHMKKVKNDGKRKEDHDKNLESFASEEKNVATLIEGDIRDSADIGKWQLQCTLCQYVNYSKASCQRHVKNKHRPFGDSVVRFDKYHENDFKGSIYIGKITDSNDEKQSIQELKILDWTQSDEEDVAEITIAQNELITLELTSDAEDENEDEETEITRSDQNVDVKKGISCQECSYLAKNNMHLAFHHQLTHQVWEEDYVFKCPKRSCKFIATAKTRLRIHLRRRHKLKADLFYPQELNCPDCVYVAKKPGHLMLHKAFAHRERPLKKGTGQTSEYDRKADSNRGQSGDKVQEAKGALVKNSKLTCKFCGEKHQGVYQVAWHMSKSHGNNAELLKWRLQCMLCNYENSSKLKCHRHGLKHKIHRVQFRKYYEEKLKGVVGFWYPKTLKPKQGTSDSKKVVMTLNQNEEVTTEFHDPPSTTGDMEVLVDESNVDEEKAIDFNSDDEVKEHKKVESDVDNLLEKKAEFFTCSLCNYETKHQSYIPLHELLVHGLAIGEENAYQCKDCNTFVSKYRHNFKRHLEGCHDYNTEEFYTQEQVKMAIRPKTNNKNHNKKVDKVKKLPTYDCRKCGYKLQNRYLLDWHMFRAHRNKTELMKWTLECTLCKYETYSKKYARNHASAVHSDDTESTLVQFEKFYKNELAGRLSYKLEPRQIYRCIKCDYVSPNWDNLRHHYRRHKVRKDRSRIKANKRVKTKLDSAIREKREKVETVEGDENDAEEINSSDETEQHEIIRIEIAPDSDDEANENEDLPGNVEDLELLTASNKLLKDSEHLKGHKADALEADTQVASESGDEVPNIEDSTQNDEEFEQKEDLKKSKSVKGHKKSVLESDDLSDEEHSKDDLEDPDQNKTNVHKNSSDDEDDESDDSPQNFTIKAQKESIKNTKDSKGVNNEMPNLPEYVSYVTNQCIHRGCKYESSTRGHLKHHCFTVHKDSKAKLDPIFLKLNKYECGLCQFQSPNRKEISFHMGDSHDMELETKSDRTFVCPKCEKVYKDRYQRASHMFKVHRDKTELLKYRLRCTLCSYEIYYKKYANRHGRVNHSSTTKPMVVKFKQFYENEFEGFISYRYGIRSLYRCSKCKFATGTQDCLNRHIVRHKRANFIPLYQVSDKAAEYVKKRQKRLINKADFIDDVTDRQSDTVSVSYNKRQILDIIGLSSPEIKTEDNVVGKFNNYETEEMVDELSEEHVEDLKVAKNIPSTKTSVLDPFTGEFIMYSSDEEGSEQGETSFPEPKGFNCSKVSCNYSCDSLKKVTDHIKLCTQNKSPRVKIQKKFVCSLCEKVLTSRLFLQKHSKVHADALNKPDLVVLFSEHTNDNFTCDLEIEANAEEKSKSKSAYPKPPAKISYKCWMCGVVIVTKATLANHTNLHAREDENFDLKVRYSKFSDEKLEGTIIMHADPNYSPRKKKRARSPALDYDPTLPVFGCNECNFKTNQKGELKKHKNLHWTPQKEALFKAQKWFTCSMCFFHCFDVKQFKEHCEWHKTHYAAPGGIKKMGKDSWFLK